MAQFEAARCFYTALSFAAGEQHEQAYSLMERAVQRIEAAVRKWEVWLVPSASRCLGGMGAVRNLSSTCH